MPRLRLEILTNDAAQTPEIDDFIDTAANGTIYHRPRFLGYHGRDKLKQCGVEFRHLVFRRKSKIAGFFPGALTVQDDGCEYRSPWGASIGGLVIAPGASFSEIDQMVAIWLDQLENWGVSRASLTLTPVCFQRELGQETVEFVLSMKGFCYAAPAFMMAVQIKESSDFPAAVLGADARRRARRSAEAGCEAYVGRDLDSFWPVLAETMQGHESTPTHSKSELQELLDRFPEAFSIHLAQHYGRTVAGMLLIEVTARAATTFYICSTIDSRRLSPVNLLAANALRWARDRGLEWIDYGPCNSGMQVGMSLVHFKEENAGRGVLRRAMTYDLVTASPHHETHADDS